MSQAVKVSCIKVNNNDSNIVPNVAADGARGNAENARQALLVVLREAVLHEPRCAVNPGRLVVDKTDTLLVTQAVP